MKECNTHQLAALAMGIGAGATAATFLPMLDWAVIGVTAISGYAGGLLPDIDDQESSNFTIIKNLTRIAAVVVPGIQFFYRPTDLLLAIPLALFMLSHFWDLLHQMTKRGGGTHSVLAAVCLSLGVSWVAYLTAGYAAVVPAFIAAGVGYVVHLLLDDLSRPPLPPNAAPSRMGYALTILGKGKSVEFYGLLSIGLACAIALWGI